MSTNPTYVRIAETMQAYLAQVGVRAKIIQREAATTRGAARKGETDMILKDWYADYPDAENFLGPLLHSANKGVGGNVSFFANAEYDRLVDAFQIVVRREPLGSPVEWTEEETYFFKLSAFQDRLLAHYETHPDFILPPERRNEVVSFVKGGLADLSVSRTTLDWSRMTGDGAFPYVQAR